MLTEWGRRNIKFILEPLARLAYKLRITPDAITVIGVFLSLMVGILIVTDRIFWSGILYIVAASADAVDGTLARQMGLRSTFGAFWDSTLDRLGESIVIGAIGYWAALNGNATAVLLAFTALTASFLVSYTRSRAEGLGLECKVGIGTRVERFVIMSAFLILQLPVWGLLIISLAAGVTVVQRIYVVWRQTRPT